MEQSRTTHPLELWAGVECTVNRVGEYYFDQVERSGHSLRIADLTRLAELGIKAVRYPVLWERTAPRGIGSIDWSWTDERLARLKELDLKPVVGLLHHGSGPRYTNLTDQGFAKKLAKFAGAVAQRYPWVPAYTPVNEPLTTARFCGLYGHWYPHARDPLIFARAFLNQCRAVVLSMRAIRSVNPAAQLIQTEDIGKTFSTPALNYQAEFENERRWLTFDLLSGRVCSGHPMWDYLRWLGISDAELLWFLDNQCVPDIIGINHYVTSQRFLDERCARYPQRLHGGNGRHRYADVEAVRVCAEGIADPRILIGEVWDRYGLPLAITEAHLSCSREEQLRWLNAIWQAAIESAKEGIDIRAVTAWSAFGAYDWDSLLTINQGHYEPGLFDLRSPTPRPTALAGMVRTLSRGEEFKHPVLDSPGWWQRFDRLCYPPVARPVQGKYSIVRNSSSQRSSNRVLLITGATGTLGRESARICEQRGLAYRLLSRQELDIASPASVRAALECYDPWAIVNAAGYVRVDDAEGEIESCNRDNLSGPRLLAEACCDRDIALLTFSSDLVFDGTKGGAYFESDNVSPLNVYGRSKAQAEESVLKTFPKALVIRSSAFFGPWDDVNFAVTTLGSLANHAVFKAASDAIISPTYIPDLVNASLDLLIDGECGLWHLANRGAISWADFARMLADRAGYDPARVEGVSTVSLGLRALRPAFSPLASERGALMPVLEDAVERFFEARSKRPPERKSNSTSVFQLGIRLAIAGQTRAVRES
jgi:dTDP-4-dehydrorhamnose reductase